MPFLVIIHAVLGVACLALRGAAGHQRAAGLRFLAAIGAACSAILFLARGADAVWGSMEFGSQRAGLVAVAGFCAWLLVLAGDGTDRARWDLGALVGAGVTALAVLATTRWIVPVLLFWTALSVLTLVAARSGSAGAHIALAVALADLCFVGALIGYALEQETWALPEAIDGVWIFPAAVAVVIRAGVLPVVGVGAALGRPEGSLAPLVIASGFAVIPFVSAGDEVAVALPLLLVAAAAIAWSLALDRPRLSVIATWPVATMLGIAWIEPEAIAKAGAAAALAVALISLWPWTSGRAQSERGLVLAALPATIGFGAIVAGASSSFGRAVGETSILQAAPWDAFAALLPAVVAGGVALGATIGRRTELELFRPEAVIAAWVLSGVALVTGLAPVAELGLSSGSGPAGRAVPLFVLAVLAAVAAARFAPRSSVPVTPGRPAPSNGAIEFGGKVAQWVRWGAIGGSALAGVAVLWLTYSGLATGFL